MTLHEVAKELARRLSSIFLRDPSGKRPVTGGTRKFQDDPHWKDYRVLDLFSRRCAAYWLQTSTAGQDALMTRDPVAGKPG